MKQNKTNLHIWHNLNGEIVAIGHRIGTLSVMPLGGQDQFVLEVEVEEESIARLHETHVVDIHKKCLVKAVNNQSVE